MRFRTPGPVAIVYALAFAYLVGKAALFREKVPPGVPPDELAHVSFVAYVRETGRLLPRYEEMRILDDAGGFGPVPSYLPHPSLYYAALGGLDRLGGGAGGTRPDVFTRRLRLVVAPLFAATAALFLFLGWRRTAPPADHLVYAAAIATVPPLAFVGASVNNDGLAFLAGGIALLGLARWLEGRADALTGTLVGAGLSLALLSKLTAGLLVSLAVLASFAFTRRLASSGRDRRFALAALPWLVLPVLHFVPVFLRYGTPLPSLEVTHPADVVRAAFVAGSPADPATLLTWSVQIAKILATTWFSISGHVWLPVGPVWRLAGPVLLLALALVGLLAPARPGPDGDRAGLTLARIGAGAVVATLLLNLVWAYAGYCEAGRVGGIHARYYLPLLPCLGLAAAAGARRLTAGPWLAVLLAALLVFTDLGVTFRTLALFPG